MITDSDLPGSAGEEILEAAGLVVRRADCVTAEDVVRAGRGADALVVQWATVSGQALAELAGLRFISRLGIGYDMIDVPAATRHGIAVANTPTYCVEEVATHTTAMILALTRGLPAYDSAVRSGTWAATQARPMAARPSASTVLIVGFGRIGSMAAANVSALGFRVLVHDPLVDDGVVTGAGYEPVALDHGLSRADVISLHAPLSESTRHLLDAASLARVKPGAVVVNTCRGPLIDEVALADALESGRLGGAALDVYVREPLPADSRLRTLGNVLLTPHAAWYSPQAMNDLPVHAATNVVDFLAGRSVASIVNPAYATRARQRPTILDRGRR